MKKLFYILNIVLVLILIYIIQYPKIQQGKIVKTKIAFYPSPASFPVFVAKEKGFFEKEKVDAEIIKTSLPEVIDELKRGKVDIVVGYSPIDFFIRQKEEIENYKIISDVEDNEDFVYASLFGFGKLKEIKDIKNSLFYYPSQRMEGKFIGKKLSENFGLNISNIFEYQTVFPQIIEGLALVYEPYRLFFLKRNVKVLIDDVFKEFFGEGSVIGSVLCSKVTLAYNRRAYERFKVIWDESVDYIKNNPDEAKNLYIAYCVQYLDADFLKEDLENYELKLPRYKKTEEVSDLNYLTIVRILKNSGFIFTEPDLANLFEVK
ncbi:MAG: ABC transporter substrate-binding protein [candidate division WOR-3 bacterium]